MLTLNNLTKSYDKNSAVVVLDDINYTFEPGTVYGLVGINGAGKSTLIRTIAGVYKPTKGSVLYNGNPVFNDVTSKKDIIFLSDAPFFFANSSIDDMRKFLSSFYEFDNNLFNELHSIFKIDVNKKIDTFSKGMKKQCELMLGLCCKPKILLLDETFDGLDPSVVIKVRTVLLDMVAKYDLTIIISSHNLLGLDSLCDYILMLDNNKLILDKELDSIDSTDATENHYKLQVYFQDSNTMHVVNGMSLNILSKVEVGSVVHLVVKGNLDDIQSEINNFNPTILDVLQLTFEEKFIYEQGGVKNE